MDALIEMGYTIWVNIGSIFNVCLYIFMLILGLYALLEVVSHLGR